MHNFEMVNIAPTIWEWLRNEGGVSENLKVEHAGEAGSARRYFRLSSGEKSWMLQHSNSQDPEFEHFVNYAKKFEALDLPAPRIYSVDEENWQVLLSDLGDKHLRDRIIGAGEETTREMYMTVIKALISWQEKSEQIFEALPQLAERVFAEEDLLWETAYFAENVLHKELGWDREKTGALHPWFTELANQVSQHPTGFMHRDLQSENIMLCEQDRCCFIDFQGARKGSLFYDIASLLWDPYVELPLEMIRNLFDYYLQENSLLASEDPQSAWEKFLFASLQRLMQACGAYSYLSRVKGKPNFGMWLSPGLRQLRTVLEISGQNQNLELGEF